MSVVLRVETNMNAVDREGGILLQRHGEYGETRAHWSSDEGGGSWLTFVTWWRHLGAFRPEPNDKLSFIALEALRVALNERAATPARETPKASDEACGCRVPGPGNGNSKCLAPPRAVCQCVCYRAQPTPSTETR